MSKFQSIYGKVRSELVILGGSILAAIGLVAALTTGTVHTVAQDALPVAALVIAVVTRNKVFSAATVADLVATAKSIAALKAAKPDQFTGTVQATPLVVFASNPPLPTTTTPPPTTVTLPSSPPAAQNFASPAPPPEPPASASATAPPVPTAPAPIPTVPTVPPVQPAPTTVPPVPPPAS